MLEETVTQLAKIFGEPIKSTGELALRIALRGDRALTLAALVVIGPGIELISGGAGQGAFSAGVPLIARRDARTIMTVSTSQHLQVRRAGRGLCTGA